MGAIEKTNNVAALVTFSALMFDTQEICKAMLPLKKDEFFVLATTGNSSSNIKHYVMKAHYWAETCVAPSPTLTGHERLQWAESANLIIGKLNLEKIFLDGKFYVKPVSQDMRARAAITWGRIVTDPYNVVYVDVGQLWLDLNSVVEME